MPVKRLRNPSGGCPAFPSPIAAESEASILRLGNGSTAGGNDALGIELRDYLALHAPPLPGWYSVRDPVPPPKPLTIDDVGAMFEGYGSVEPKIVFTACSWLLDDAGADLEAFLPEGYPLSAIEKAFVEFVKTEAEKSWNARLAWADAANFRRETSWRYDFAEAMLSEREV